MQFEIIHRHDFDKLIDFGTVPQLSSYAFYFLANGNDEETNSKPTTNGETSSEKTTTDSESNEVTTTTVTVPVDPVEKTEETAVVVEKEVVEDEVKEKDEAKSTEDLESTAEVPMDTNREGQFCLV